MMTTPARRICTILLSVVSAFYLIGLIPSPATSGATSNTHVSVTVPTHVVPAVAKPKPKWYSPIFAEGPKARAFFTCVENRESRSTWAHPHTHDPSGDQYGIFQFSWPSPNNVWDAYVLPKLHVEPPYASAFEQAEGAAIIWRMHDEYQTWSRWDGCPDDR